MSLFVTVSMADWPVMTVTALLKKPCRNAPNSDADNGGAEPSDVGVGIFQPPRRLVRATGVHIGISRSFFYSVAAPDMP
jgi:hypothetical protein